jgi:hypothetical protein
MGYDTAPSEREVLMTVGIMGSVVILLAVLGAWRVPLIRNIEA